LDQNFNTTPLFEIALNMGEPNLIRTIHVYEVKNYIGETLSVCGNVFGGKYLEDSNKKLTLINMGGAYPNSLLTIVILNTDRINFSYKPEQYLTYKKICVTGLIKLHNGIPEILINSESKILLK
jgi:hypothetical protein